MQGVRSPGPIRTRQDGYSMVALIVALIVLNIAVAAVMPLWSKVMQREREEELIFRGLQYAEAIRVFEGRFNRPPNTLEELLEVEPRSIRQLWRDPVSETGEWKTLLAGSGSESSDVLPTEDAGAAARVGQDLSRPIATDRSQGASDSVVDFDDLDDFEDFEDFDDDFEPSEIGPIEGVRSTAEGEAARFFLGSRDYERWEFRAQMLAEPRVSAEGVPLAPRLDPGALGRPFPDGIALEAPASDDAPSGGRNPLDEAAATGEEELDN